MLPRSTTLRVLWCRALCGLWASARSSTAAGGVIVMYGNCEIRDFSQSCVKIFGVGVYVILFFLFICVGFDDIEFRWVELRKICIVHTYVVWEA